MIIWVKRTPRAVSDTTPITIPAVAQAMATGTAVRTPYSRAATTSRQGIRFSRTRVKQEAVATSAHIPQNPASMGEYCFITSRYTSMNSGTSRCSPLSRWSRRAGRHRPGKPGSPFLGLEIDHQAHGKKIQQRGNGGRDGHLGVGDAQNSAMTNAPAPMTGGMIWPPVEATASTAPAKRANSRSFSSGEW